MTFELVVLPILYIFLCQDFKAVSKSKSNSMYCKSIDLKIFLLTTQTLTKEANMYHL